MESTARVAVIGGGAVGCSIAYHLARHGWEEVTLLERDELTSGSTWHAAGLLPLFNMSYAVSHIHDYSVRFYGEVGEESGLDPGFSRVGNLRMAQTQERMDEYMVYATTAETAGVPYEWLTAKEIGDRWPLVRNEDLVGALYHPTDGYINPADVTQAMAKAARLRGVRIHRKKHVSGFSRTASGEWRVSGVDRENGEAFEIAAEHVVAATGNHALATAAGVGVMVPAIPVEHQYVVTGESSSLRAWREEGNEEHPVLRDADARWYVREERKGWILGPYESTAPAWAVWGVPESFLADLLPANLERIEEELMSGIHRVPSFEEGGVKEVFNGPISYTPDGNPLVGPAPGVDNFWLAEGFSFGITAAGGVGHYLAQMMVEGEAEIDMWSLDPRRYGDWMTRAYARAKNEEAYAHVYVLHHPDEEREACRPLRTAPCYDRLKERGAVFGQINGWERPNYFAPIGEEFDDRAARSFRRGVWWEFARAEAEVVRDGLGMFDATAFAKHRAHGPGTAAFLDWLTCNRLPSPGRISLSYGLTDAGTIRTEFTILRLAEDDFYLVTAGAAQAYDYDYLCKEAARGEDRFGRVHVEDETARWGVFAIAGPRSRDLLRRVVHAQNPETEFTNAAFPWLSGRRVELGMCPVRAIRVSYAGELGWELHHPMEMQNYLFDLLWDAGQEVGMRLCGARAQNWLRQEKSYRAFGSDLGRDATPLEGGLDRFVDMSKDFRGKEAMVKTGMRSRCVTLLIDGPKDADPWGREALYGASGERRIGRLTSGGWSVHFRRQIGIGYVAPDQSDSGTAVQVKMLDRLWPAEVVADSPYDSEHTALRADG